MNSGSPIGPTAAFDERRTERQRHPSGLSDTGLGIDGWGGAVLRADDPASARGAALEAVMMAELDLSDFLADDCWHVGGVVSSAHPAGREYAIPSPSYADGVLIARLYNLTEGATGTPSDDAVAALTELCRRPDGEVATFEHVLLGSAAEQMLADGVSTARVSMVAQLAFLRWARGEDAVRRAIDTTAAPSPAAKKPPAKKTAKAAPRKPPAKKVARTATSRKATA